MKRIDVLNIYNVVAGLKIGSVNVECAHALLKVRLNLADPVKKIGEDQKVALEELKPEGFDKENQDMVREYNERFGSFMMEYMNEELNVILPQITEEDVCVLGKANNLTVNQLEVLMNLK